MAREWTDEEVKKEIADAIAIVREDKILAFMRGNGPKPDNGPTNDPPPPNNNPNEPPKRKGLWWGEETQ
jgi:hypothetical protein